MSELTKLGMAETRDLLEAGETSAREVTEAHVAAVEAARPLNAFITETPEIALEMAEASDQRRSRGDAPGVMEGLPIGMKDLFCTEGTLTTAGSHILEDFKPQYESTVSQKLWSAGAVMLGKTNLDEFAMGSSNMTSYYGNVENPWRRQGDNRPLVPGGSSGGSAAIVAARAALGATGTDTGGSIRQPAAFSGIVGMKPTYGRCSRWGIVAFASSLDQAGPLTRSVRDAAIMLEAMAGHDPKDSTSVDRPVPNYEAALTGDIPRPQGRGAQGVPHRRHAGGDRPPLAAGHRLADRRRCRGRGGLPAAHQVRPADLLHRGAGRGLLEPGTLRRRALRPRVPPTASTACTRPPAAKVSAPRSSAGC